MRPDADVGVRDHRHQRIKSGIASTDNSCPIWPLVGVATRTHWDIAWVEREARAASDWDFAWVDRETLRVSASDAGDAAGRAAQPPPDIRSDETMRTATPEEVREGTLAGVRWGVLARVGVETTALLSTAVLARLISPKQFGHAVVAIALIAVSQALVVEGFGTPLVQRREITRAHLESTMVLGLLGGLLLSVLAFGGAPLLTRPLGAQTASLIRLASPCFLIISLAVVPQALAQRRLAFRITSLIELASTVTGIVVSIALAAAGLGASALVIGQLAILATMALLYMTTASPVAPRWHRSEARELWGFGAQTAASSLLQSAWSNLDYVIVGIQLGPVATGFYWRAFQIGGEYQGKISTIMIRLSLPVLSRTRSLADMRRVRGRILRVHALVIFPLLAVYILVAPEVVPLAFGARWAPAVLPSQILAVAGMVFALAGGSGPLLVAAGHPRALLYGNIANTLSFAAVVIVFARLGLVTLCIAVAAVNLIFFIGQYYLLIDRLVGIPMSDLWGDVAPGLTSLVPLGAAGALARLACSAVGGVPAPVQIVVVAASATAAYLACLRATFPDSWADLRLLFERAVGRLPGRGGRVVRRRRGRRDDLATPRRSSGPATRQYAPD
jgi:lipopolysaccharide exporter